MLRKSILTVLVSMALISCAGTAPATGASGQTTAPQKFAFGLWGDMPYKKAGDDVKLPAVLHSINQSDIAFSMYDGDIKDGSSKCTDDVYTDALKMFGSMKKPVVYVPGDNEWTDCHRLNNGGMDPLERLAHLRRMMYATPMSLGQTQMALEHQGKPGEKFVENTRFLHGGVMFVAINMPGSNNNLVLNAKSCSNKSARKAAQCDAANAEYLERDSANVTWMSASFAQAKAQNALGLVLMVQGDPGFDLPETEDMDESQAPGVSGYRHFMSQLVQQTEQFKGQVLFVHGDTHYFKLDKPLYNPGKVLPNLTRLQTFGSPSLHWVRVTVDPAASQIFQVHPVTVEQAKN
ncbi:hypothetical protein [Rhodoferax sp.]|uniref:hypothetical protein n=1 Tax=Rhodoferax sp. TaxID=50421 RepID=UPI00271E3DD5|nr:hypothetical protein [Rhodoferax sp.]MDO8320815.1 hypothetical protein [Rhodoferax sp.]